MCGWHQNFSDNWILPIDILDYLKFFNTWLFDIFTVSSVSTKAHSSRHCAFFCPLCKPCRDVCAPQCSVQTCKQRSQPENGSLDLTKSLKICESCNIYNVLNCLELVCFKMRPKRYGQFFWSNFITNAAYDKKYIVGQNLVQVYV